MQRNQGTVLLFGISMEIPSCASAWLSNVIDFPGQDACVWLLCAGFITDPALIAQSGMSDPRPFFVSLLSRPYLNNVVISPHYYPPSISHATSQ